MVALDVRGASTRQTACRMSGFFASSSCPQAGSTHRGPTPSSFQHLDITLNDSFTQTQKVPILSWGNTMHSQRETFSMANQTQPLCTLEKERS
ncbi:hypothetical protein P7K49_004474, partial [Saguinus oedipus]